jgi:positive regulator of sigma E activity
MRTLLAFIYGISAALLIVGVVMIFLEIVFGKTLVVITIILTLIFQGWVIDKLFKKLKDKENQKEN